jgi:HAD superfamily hydrolase (TIGR01509 family)
MTFTAAPVTVRSEPRLLEAAAVLFDMDGLLLNTEPLWWIAEKLTATWLGWDYKDYDHAQLLGQSLRITAEYLRARAPEPNPDPATGEPRPKPTVEAVEAYLMVKLKYQARSYGAKAMPGASSLVTGVRLERGTLKSALVTSTERQLMYSLLGHASMKFDAYIDAQSIQEPKPAPDPYLTAAKALNTDPARCIAIEDSRPGVASATAAGCGYVIAVPPPAAPGQEQVTAEDGCLILRSLDGLAASPAGLIIRAGYL